MKENKYRDHYCGKLNNDDIGKTVTVPVTLTLDSRVKLSNILSSLLTSCWFY